jgi:hypothetical protein
MNWGLLSTARINGRLIPAIRAAERAESWEHNPDPESANRHGGSSTKHKINLK